MVRKYGRGKFNAHEKYISYMEMIVNHPHYKDMPNAVTPDGHINWQVSSGKSTSFYKFYEARKKWWEDQADKLRMPGTGNSDSRFSITARLIHPTNKRPCRLCGDELYIGYRYLNKLLANKWNKLTRSNNFAFFDEVATAAKKLESIIGDANFKNEISDAFSERLSVVSLVDIDIFFEKTSHIRSNYLSPGFMSNPPDRLDGFHDYGLCCRKTKDPGRSDINLRSYNHDRRTFKWWTQGDWLVTDALYNSAGPGKCALCGKTVSKVSPDHVGPLACGFKQIPFFLPTCGSCNSAKNRRMGLRDVMELINYEKKNHESCASWQIKQFWNLVKNRIKDDKAAKEISSVLRSIQDHYLRILSDLKDKGICLGISYILTPHLAHSHVAFEGLKVAELSYDSYAKTPKRTSGSISLESRIVRIAFEELEEYALKTVTLRKLYKLDAKILFNDLDQLMRVACGLQKDAYDKEWVNVIRMKSSNEKRELLISKLLEDPKYESYKFKYEPMLRALEKYLDDFGSATFKALKL